MDLEELRESVEIVSPIVEEVTGYEIPDVGLDIVPRDEIWEVYISGYTPDRPQTALGRAKKRFDEQIFSHSIAGICSMDDDGRAHVGVVPDNYNSEGNGHLQIAAHELTHAVQLVNHPTFVRHRSKLEAPYFKEYADEVSREDMFYAGIQMLLEGQAKRVEEEVERRHGGVWRGRGSPSPKGEYAKEYMEFRRVRMLCSAEGKFMVDRLYEVRGSDFVDGLFSLPPEELWGEIQTMHMMIRLASVGKNWKISRFT